MVNVGILTCSNSVQEAGCSSFGCFAAAYDRTGELGAHNDEIRIKGIISCAGCPSKSGFDKILRRVRSLVASGTEVLHLGNCMVLSCPFITKYEQAIAEEFPALKVVRGVHPYPPEDLWTVAMERYQEARGTDRITTPEIFRDAAASLSKSE